MARVWSSHGRDVQDAVCRLDFDLEPDDEATFGTAPPTTWTRSPVQSPPRPMPGLEELARLYEARTGQAAPVARRVEAPARVVDPGPAPWGARPAARPVPVERPPDPALRWEPAVQWDGHPDPLELPFEPEPSWEYETEMLLPRELQQTLPRLPRFVARGLHQDRAAPNDEPTGSIEPDDEQADPRPARSVRLEVFALVALGLATLVAFVAVALVIAAIALA